MDDMSGESSTILCSLTFVRLFRLVAALYLHENAFTGGIPDALLQLTTLVDLRLSDNQFKGPIPVGLQNLNRLEVLHLAQNKFKGEIPPDIFLSTTRLTELNLARNLLNSTIPTTIGHLGDLSE